MASTDIVCASHRTSAKILEVLDTVIDTVIDTNNSKKLPLSYKPALQTSSSMEVKLSYPPEGIKVNRSGSENVSFTPV